jgi:signal transduction histidine kinase
LIDTGAASRSLLLADVMTSEERERRRIAEALHDCALQTVLAAKQDLREVMRSNPLADGVVRASELLGDVSHELRQVTRELHPSVLDEAGLATAVQALVQTFTERTGLPVECVVDYPRPHRYDPTLYAVARELLANVARHVEATRVEVELRDTGGRRHAGRARRRSGHGWPFAPRALAAYIAVSASRSRWRRRANPRDRFGRRRYWPPHAVSRHGFRSAR